MNAVVVERFHAAVPQRERAAFAEQALVVALEAQAGAPVRTETYHREPNRHESADNPGTATQAAGRRGRRVLTPELQAQIAAILNGSSG